MKNLIFFLSLLFLLSACRTYYQGSDGSKYIFNQPDTLVFTWQVETDTGSYYYNELIYRSNDTLYTVQFLFDSTFNSYANYIVDSGALRMVQYYNVFSFNIMFYEIEKNLSFSFDARHVGKARERIKFVWPEQGFRFLGTNKSISSGLDTINLGDSLVQVLRVDVRYRYINKYHKPNKRPKDLTKGQTSYFYYPGLGPIFIQEKAKNYHAQVISIEKL